jgi:hypothetical protein
MTPPTTGASPAQPASASSTPSSRGHGVAAAGPSVVPLAGARPLRPTIPVQRGADTPASGAPESVPAAWTAPEDLPETVAAIPPVHGGADAVPLQRLADASAEHGGPAGPVPMRDVTFPAAGGPLPSDTGASLPGAPDLFAGPGLPGPALLGSAPATPSRPAVSPSARRGAPGGTPLQRSAQRGPTVRSSGAAPLTLARSHAPAQAAADAAAGTRITADAPAPAVQTSSAGASASTAGTSTQLPTFTATPVVQRVEGSAPEAPETSGHTDTELDELAKAIFGRIRNHLRAEVIHEREAKGLTFDAF